MLPVCQVSARALHEIGHYLSFLLSVVKISPGKEKFLEYAGEVERITISLTEEIEDNEVGGVVDFLPDSVVYKNHEIRLITSIAGCVSVYTYFRPGWKIIEEEFEDFMYRTGGREDWNLCQGDNLHSKYIKGMEVQGWFKNGLFRRLYSSLSHELYKTGVIEKEFLVGFSRKHYKDLKYISKRV